MGYTVGDTAGQDDVLRQHLLGSDLRRANLASVSARLHARNGPVLALERVFTTRGDACRFSRNAKRRDANLSKAIDDWETDLDFLFR